MNLTFFFIFPNAMYEITKNGIQMFSNGYAKINGNDGFHCVFKIWEWIEWEDPKHLLILTFILASYHYIFSNPWANQIFLIIFTR